VFCGGNSSGILMGLLPCWIAASLKPYVLKIQIDTKRPCLLTGHQPALRSISALSCQINGTGNSLTLAVPICSAKDEITHT
jgi:hypothetical protein